MRRAASRRTLLWAIALCVSPICAAEDGASGAPLARHAAKESSRDVKLPRALVARIEREYKTYLESLRGTPPEVITRSLLNISVELTQRKRAALHEDVRVVTPLGGGVMDLAEWVTPVRGAFRTKFVVKTDKDSTPSGLRVFFVSRAKQRKILGEELGAGCNKILEITSYFQRKMGDSGFDLYTSDQRYLSVLGGTFVLVAFDPEALYVGSLTFTDSRFPDLLCKEGDRQ